MKDFTDAIEADDNYEGDYLSEKQIKDQIDLIRPKLTEAQRKVRSLQTEYQTKLATIPPENFENLKK